MGMCCLNTMIKYGRITECYGIDMICNVITHFDTCTCREMCSNSVIWQSVLPLQLPLLLELLLHYTAMGLIGYIVTSLEQISSSCTQLLIRKHYIIWK